MNIRKQKSIILCNTVDERFIQKIKRNEFFDNNQNIVVEKRNLVLYSYFKKPFSCNSNLMEKDNILNSNKTECNLKTKKAININFNNLQTHATFTNYLAFKNLCFQALDTIYKSKPRNLLSNPSFQETKNIFTMYNKKNLYAKKCVNKENINNSNINSVSHYINFFESSIKKKNIPLLEIEDCKKKCQFNNNKTKDVAREIKVGKVEEKKNIVTKFYATDRKTDKKIYGTEKKNKIKANLEKIETQNTPIINAENNLSIIFQSSLQKIMKIEENAKREIERESTLKNRKNNFILNTKPNFILNGDYEIQSTNHLIIKKENTKSSLVSIKENIDKLQNNKKTDGNELTSINPTASLNSIKSVYINDKDYNENKKLTTFIKKKDKEVFKKNMIVQVAISTNKTMLKEHQSNVRFNTIKKEFTEKNDYKNMSDINVQVYDSKTKENPVYISNKLLAEMFSSKPFMVNGSTIQPKIYTQKDEFYDKKRTTLAVYKDNQLRNEQSDWFARVKNFFFCCCFY